MKNSFYAKQQREKQGTVISSAAALLASSLSEQTIQECWRVRFF